MSERRTPPSVFQKPRRAGIFLSVLMLMLLAFAFLAPADARAFTPVSGASITITPPANDLPYTGGQGASCTYSNYFYIFFVDSVTGAFYYQSSTDGNIWSTAVSMGKLTSIGSTSHLDISCYQQVLQLAWYVAGAPNKIYTYQASLSGGTVTNQTATAQFVPKTQGHSTPYSGTYNGLDFARYLNGHFFVMFQAGVAGTNAMFVVDNQNTANFTSVASTNNLQMDIAWAGGSTYMITNNLGYTTGDGASSWSQLVFASFTAYPHAGAITAVGTTTGFGNNFYAVYRDGTSQVLMTLNALTLLATKTTLGSASCASDQMSFVTTDQTNVIVAACWSFTLSISEYWYSTNAGTSWSSTNTFSANTNMNSATLHGTTAGSLLENWGTQEYFSSTIEAFTTIGEKVSSTYFLYTNLFGIPSSSAVTSGVVTIGSCPTKNTATFALTNSTIFGYLGSSFTTETLNTFNTEVASVNSGHVASETLYMLVYLGSAPGAISASNPLLLVGVKTWVLSATASPQQLSWTPNVNLGSLGSGVTFMIALLGNSKILINQSSLSGLVTSTGTGTPPLVLTSTATTATQLYLCGTASFQTVVTTTVTSTTTSTVTSGGTATTTTTSTTVLTSLNANAALGNSVGIAFVLLILLAPAFAIAVPIGVYTKSPIGVGIGFTAGLAIGALLGNQGGLIPFSVLAGMMVVVVLLIVGFLLALRSGQG